MVSNTLAENASIKKKSIKGAQVLWNSLQKPGAFPIELTAFKDQLRKHNYF